LRRRALKESIVKCEPVQNKTNIRQHFYDIKKAYAENGLEGLKDKTRRKHSRKRIFLLVTAKVPVTAAGILNDRVLPFFESHMIPVLRVLTDRETEYTGVPEKHLFELYLQMNDIEHTTTKAKSPLTKGICERFNQTVLNEFYKIAFRKNIYKSVEQLQEDLDFFMLQYNEERTHQGKRCKANLRYIPLVTVKSGRDISGFARNQVFIELNFRVSDKIRL